MTKNNEELEAAKKYADPQARYSPSLGDAMREAFLAGVEWQKNRYHEPDKEYYGG